MVDIIFKWSSNMQIECVFWHFLCFWLSFHKNPFSLLMIYLKICYLTWPFSNRKIPNFRWKAEQRPKTPNNVTFTLLVQSLISDVAHY